MKIKPWLTPRRGRWTGTPSGLLRYAPHRLQASRTSENLAPKDTTNLQQPNPREAPPN